MTKWLLSVVVVAHVSLSLYEIDLNDEAERLKLVAAALRHLFI